MPLLSGNNYQQSCSYYFVAYMLPWSGFASCCFHPDFIFVLQQQIWTHRLCWVSSNQREANLKLRNQYKDSCLIRKYIFIFEFDDIIMRYRILHHIRIRWVIEDASIIYQFLSMLLSVIPWEAVLSPVCWVGVGPNRNPLLYLYL